MKQIISIKFNYIERAIIGTIALFNSFHISVSLMKIYNNLLNQNSIYFKKPTIQELSSNIDNLIDKKIVFLNFGQYYLIRSFNECKDCIEKIKIADSNFKVLKKYKKFFKFVPYLKAIFITGSLNIEASNKSSDIDLLVITKKNTIWFTRIYMTLFFDLLGIRRRASRIAAKFCLNHFVEDSNLAIKDRTIYDSLNYKNVIPFYQRDKDIYGKFISANQWIGKHFYTFGEIMFSKEVNFYENHIISNFLECVFFPFIHFPLYHILKKVQVEIIKKNPLTYMKNAKIVYNNNEIIFHPEPRSVGIVNNFKRKVRLIFD